jgi:hypothetical protein
VGQALSPGKPPQAAVTLPHEFMPQNVTATRVAASRASSARSRLFKFLDRSAGRLERRGHAADGRIATPIASLLGRYRSFLSLDEWRVAIVNQIRPHPMLAYLHEDPFSSHGFRKPRGYEGDAVLLDFIYGGGASSVWVKNASLWERSSIANACSIFVRCAAGPPRLPGRRLAASCAAGGRTEIPSVACGHLR